MVNPFTTVFFGLTGVWGYPMLSFLGTDLQAIKKGRGLVKFFFSFRSLPSTVFVLHGFPFCESGLVGGRNKKEEN